MIHHAFSLGHHYVLRAIAYIDSQCLLNLTLREKRFGSVLWKKKEKRWKELESSQTQRAYISGDSSSEFSPEASEASALWVNANLLHPLTWPSLFQARTLLFSNTGQRRIIYRLQTGLYLLSRTDRQRERKGKKLFPPEFTSILPHDLDFRCHVSRPQASIQSFFLFDVLSFFPSLISF